MESDKFSKVWKILKEFNFEKAKNVSGSLKCIRCTKILRNVCQVSCGCEFCLECIEEMQNEGLKNCIGSTEDCTNAKLSNYFINYKTNKEILNLVLKCPEDDCAVECELINMVDHLRLCPKKAMPCIFFEFGCNKDKVKGDTIQEHYFKEQESHNKIILETILSLKNEINEGIEKNKATMDTWKRHIIEIKERNKKDVEILKYEMSEFKKQSQMELEMLKKDLFEKEEKIKSIFRDIKKKDQEIISKDVEINSMKEEICQLNERLKKLEDDENQSEITEGNSELKLPMTMSTTEENTKLPDVTFEWNFYLLRNGTNGSCFDSPDFCDTRLPFKMKMKFLNCESYYEINAFFLSSSNVYDDSQWPLTLEIFIKIKDEDKSVSFLNYKKTLLLKKVTRFYVYKLTEPIKFPHLDFIDKKDRLNFILECDVTITKP